MNDDDSFRLISRETAGQGLLLLLLFALIFWPYVR